MTRSARGVAMALSPLPPPERRFDSPALDALATAVIFATADHSVVYANSAAENLFKLSNKNVHGHKLSEMFVDDSALVMAIDAAAERNCTYMQHELQLNTAGDERFDVSCAVTPAQIDDVDGFLLEFTELHQQLRIAREARMLDQSEAS